VIVGEVGRSRLSGGGAVVLQRGVASTVTAALAEGNKPGLILGEEVKESTVAACALTCETRGRQRPSERAGPRAHNGDSGCCRQSGSEQGAASFVGVEARIVGRGVVVDRWIMS
jgi:hypothetical protein